LRLSLTEALPSAGITLGFNGTAGLSPRPTRPGLSLASYRLIPTAITAGASCVAPGLLCLHAIPITPAGSRELVRSLLSIVSGLPCVRVRNARFR